MIQQHKLHHNGRPAYWTAGHTIDGSTTAEPWLSVNVVPPLGDWLAPEASVCNYGANARRTNGIKAPTVAPTTTRRW